MKAKPIVPRELANRDVEGAIGYYLREASAEVAIAFIAALEKAYAEIARAPGAGSPRYAHELNLGGLRSWPLKRYPQLIFYVERTDYVDVWRVLHGERDIPGGVRLPEGR
ncbi:MAG: type II toxin-antitoxin system RelE/ParE family toxin [Vicinamibacteria bacterium]